ncbi:hypothetical protein HK097_010606 [Rhizophlyctis rosea]|uniref:RING-type E3 ubiquitin transferase n=1 Tax=Rhizophlyctis rosea TaxID=64517 RepID=A0AAD5SI32_9FUNG|nr:hypothetical protein HK097_010606 [Rhizophlyctis rosea]
MSTNTAPSTSQKRRRSPSPSAPNPRRPHPVEENTEDHTCPLCLKLIVHPVTANCNHSFCQPCLKELFKVGSPTRGMDSLKADWAVDDVVTRHCPMCRKLVMKRVAKTVNVNMETYLKRTFPITYPARLQEAIDEPSEQSPPYFTKKIYIGNRHKGVRPQCFIAPTEHTWTFFIHMDTPSEETKYFDRAEIILQKDDSIETIVSLQSPPFQYEQKGQGVRLIRLMLHLKNEWSVRRFAAGHVTRDEHGIELLWVLQHAGDGDVMEVEVGLKRNVVQPDPVVGSVGQVMRPAEHSQNDDWRVPRHLQEVVARQREERERQRVVAREERQRQLACAQEEDWEDSQRLETEREELQRRHAREGEEIERLEGQREELERRHAQQDVEIERLQRQREEVEVIVLESDDEAADFVAPLHAGDTNNADVFDALLDEGNTNNDNIRFFRYENIDELMPHLRRSGSPIEFVGQGTMDGYQSPMESFAIADFADESMDEVNQQIFVSSTGTERRQRSPRRRRTLAEERARHDLDTDLDEYMAMSAADAWQRMPMGRRSLADDRRVREWNRWSVPESRGIPEGSRGGFACETTLPGRPLALSFGGPSIPRGGGPVSSMQPVYGTPLAGGPIAAEGNSRPFQFGQYAAEMGNRPFQGVQHTLPTITRPFQFAVPQEAPNDAPNSFSGQHVHFNPGVMRPGRTWGRPHRYINPMRNPMRRGHHNAPSSHTAELRDERRDVQSEYGGRRRSPEPGRCPW